MSKNNKKIRKSIRRIKNNRLRLSVFSSNTNIYAQIIDDKENITKVSASSIKFEKGNDIKAAAKVGEQIAEKAKKSGITSIYLDRNGKVYTGKLKALCDAARNKGMNF